MRQQDGPPRTITLEQPMIAGSSASAPEAASTVWDDPASAAAIDLSIFAIPLGLAGLAGVWQAMRATSSVPAWPSEALFALSGAIWLAVLIAYATNRLGDPRPFAPGSRQAVYGPFIAYAPVVGILLSLHYVEYVGDAARTAVIVFIVILVALIAELLAHWLNGNTPIETFHPGYFLPVVAGAFIASVGLTTSGWHEAAEATFGIGAFFWLVIGGLVFGRLFVGPPLPDALKPLLSVLVSAPATAGIAWFALRGGSLDVIEYLLLGVLFVMVAIQLSLVPVYRKLRFTPTFWAFTFPAAATANIIVRWLGAAHYAAWEAWSWAVTATATSIIAAIAVATIVDAYATRSSPGHHVDVHGTAE
jgi:tellurite resistance protein